MAKMDLISTVCRQIVPTSGWLSLVQNLDHKVRCKKEQFGRPVDGQHEGQRGQTG